MLLSTYLEVSNEEKHLNRQGEVEDGVLFTHRTESKAFLNSLAASSGFRKDKLTFATCHPCRSEDTDKADLGFDVSVLVNDEAAQAANTSYIEDHEILQESESEDANDLLDDDEEDVELEDDSTARIEAKVDWLLPQICKRESTHLTGSHYSALGSLSTKVILPRHGWILKKRHCSNQ
jgi:hypothetical protein